MRPIVRIAAAVGVLVALSACGGDAPELGAELATVSVEMASLPDGTLPASAEVVMPPAPDGSPAQAGAAPGGAVSGAVPAPAAAEPRSPDGYPLHPFLPAGGRARVVVLDPGHGGPEVGSAGAGVAEKDINLSIARRLRALLEADGFIVVLVRDCDCRATVPPGYEPPANWQAARWDLQARLDIANLADGDVYLSIHNNGSNTPSESGTEVWYDGRRPFAAYNLALAQVVLEEQIRAIRSWGYPTINRGLKEDTYFRVRDGRAFPIFVLGPPRSGVATTRAARMPAALGESLFLSNVNEAPFLARESMQDAIAAGYYRALVRYFALIDNGDLALPPEGLAAETPNYYDTQGPPPGSQR